MEIREQKNITGVQIRRVEIQQRGKMQRIPHIAHIDEDARGAPTRDQDHPVMANAVIATDDPTTTLKAMNQKIENDTAVETGAQNRPTTTTPQSLRQDHQDPTEKEKIQNQIHAPNVHPQTQTQTTLSPPSSAQHHHQPPAPAVAAPEQLTAQPWTSASTIPHIIHAPMSHYQSQKERKTTGPPPSKQCATAQRGGRKVRSDYGKLGLERLRLGNGKVAGGRRMRGI
jgi:hypothetical protein